MENGEKLEELNPELFTWDSYEYDFGHRLDSFWNAYPEIFQFNDFIAQLKKRAIGWCDATRVPVKPKNEGYAVMCEDEDGKFWFHILDQTANALGIKKESND